MDIHTINNTIEMYEKLIVLVHRKVEQIASIDSLYNPNLGIESINFNDSNVHVLCDATCMGSYDSHSFKFPLVWLCLENEDLKDVVLTSKELRETKLLEERNSQILKQKEEKEQKERQEFDRLFFNYGKHLTNK